jgi:hypothetical protein
MFRRLLLLGVASAVMLTLVGFQREGEGKLLILDWARKARLDKPPVAVLVEMGLKDTEPTDWSGKALVEGAKVVHREGYHFRGEDRLIAPDGWEARSRRPLRLPPKNPALIKTEGVDPVGVVLQLADVKDDATLVISSAALEPGRVSARSVSIKDLLSGKPAILADGKARIRLISTATPVVTDKTEDDFPAAAYGPDGTLWLAYISYHVKDDGRRIETGQLKAPPASFKDYYTPEFGDQLFVKHLKGGKWSEAAAVTGAKEDLVRASIVADKEGQVHVLYSANRQGTFKVFEHKINMDGAGRMRVSEAMQYPHMFSPALAPASCVTPVGHEILLSVAQGWDEKGPSWFSWHPAVAAGPRGDAKAWDNCKAGDYDVFISASDWGMQALDRPNSPPKETKVEIASSRFEARPSICYDPKGRLWIAYEEGPEKWGKDYGVLDDSAGNPLYNTRNVRVVCLVDGKLMKPDAELPTAGTRAPPLGFAAPVAQSYEKTIRYSGPQIGIDGKGRVWLTYRQKFGNRYSTHPGSYWITFARRLDSDHWSEPIELHHSDGLLDHRPVLLPHPAGGLLVLHNTDGRWTTPEQIDNQIYMSYVDLPGEPAEPKLAGHDVGKKDPKLVEEAKKEQASVKRIRDYRIEAGGKKYQLLRGEFHRHTELSWDGGPDGSLEDMFRYAIDAAQMDWIGNGDHDSGAGREYSWWLIQKYTDAYHLKGHFTPMFTYERSVGYPHGHRNCMFAQRGVRTLPRLAPEPGQTVGGAHADDTKMLYRYLKEMDGICAVHTSATSMGTDWRDNDPAVEPFVEIYQGDRMSYEYEGAPRAGYNPKDNRLPANIAGWYPAGFVNLALGKGYRLGFQASSDHWSTHISYCIAVAEKNDRQAILDAYKKRHCYGATDDIILDVRSGDRIMGDEFKTGRPPGLQIKVIGTGPIAQIDIHKDSQVVETIRPNAAEWKGSWSDPKPFEGTHYYYVRVLQADGELAWGSPMWVTWEK